MRRGGFTTWILAGALTSIPGALEGWNFYQVSVVSLLLVIAFTLGEPA